ncbi:MAG: HAD-IC family P-type ATPase [Planctomycetaceae bacterium]
MASEWPEAFAGDQGPGIVARMAANPDAPGQTHEVMIGSARFLSEREITISDDGQAAAAKLLADGQSPLFVAIDGRLAGVIGLRETLRPESQSVLRALKREGIQGFALLTGDRHSPTETVSRALGGFDHVAAEQRPDEKARWIESLRRAGRRVAMIGDGVNDAPALAAADVGLAVCRSGNELAGEAGDILLLRDRWAALPDRCNCRGTW